MSTPALQVAVAGVIAAVALAVWAWAALADARRGLGSIEGLQHMHFEE
jgi:hypothetical protein